MASSSLTRAGASLALLLALGGCEGAGAEAQGEGPRVVRISMEHSSFSPSRIEVEEGDTVRFVLRNDDPIDHEFIVGDEEVQLRHERGTEQEHGAIPGEISVPAGTSAETTYTFEESGEVIFGCHLPGHYDYGMRGVVAVR